MSKRPLVLLTTEGTYPYHMGGVSTWCDTLVHHLPDVDFQVFAIAMNPYVTTQFDIPSNVQQVISVPLWGMQDPSEHRTDVSYSEIFLQKQRTDIEAVQTLFIPVFERVLQGISGVLPPGELGLALAQLYRYFRTYDYQVTFKNERVWECFKAWILQAAGRGFWEQPTVFEAVQGLGWIYHFLTVINTPIPRVDIVHASAAAFCGMVGIVAKAEYGTPYVLTEHGVYLREQYLGIGRSAMTPFSKRFLLALVRAIARENLYYADELAPVCAFNGRWERVLGADPKRIRVIYNGVSQTKFYPSLGTAAVRAEEPVTVLSVARIDPNKDLETLVRAMAIVQSMGVSARALVYGSTSVPEYRTVIEQLRVELGVEEVVELAGHHDDMAAAYRQADIVVQSSVTEAFPYSVIEAMMSGRPVVATEVGGTAEALGAAGILVPSRDPAMLAAGIAMLATNPDLRAELGQKARARAVEYFEITKTLDAFTRLYRRWMRQGESDGLKEPGAILLLQRAQALVRLGQTTLALEQARAALAVLESKPAMLFVLAQVAEWELRLGRIEEAKQHLIKAQMIRAVLSA